jgi:hypothetical protein
LPKIKENEGLRGDVLEYVAQENPQFDVEIGQKNHFRMETTSIKSLCKKLVGNQCRPRLAAPLQKDLGLLQAKSDKI